MRFKSLTDVPDQVARRYPASRWVVWRPTPRGQRWLVRLDFAHGHDMDCIGLEIRSHRQPQDGGWPDFLPDWDEGPAPLQRRLLRDLPLGQILSDLGEEITKIYEDLAHAFRQPIGDAEDDAAALRDAQAIDAYVTRRRATKRGRGQQRGIPDLDAIAAVYLAAKAARRPTAKAVADWGQVSESTATKWIMRVRRETDLLPTPTNRPRKGSTKRTERS